MSGKDSNYPIADALVLAAVMFGLLELFWGVLLFFVVLVAGHGIPWLAVFIYSGVAAGFSCAWGGMAAAMQQETEHLRNETELLRRMNDSVTRG